jgi:hypothetical protein
MESPKKEEPEKNAKYLQAKLLMSIKAYCKEKLIWWKT